MPTQPLFGITDIERILPHRSPFLFVDRVVEVATGKRIKAEKDIEKDACFFSGHFPGRPIMPGVLISEALAQTSGLLLGLTWKEESLFEDKNPPALFLANVNIKFLSPAKPDDTLLLEASLKKEFGGLYLFDVVADVSERKIAEGTLTLALAKP